MSFSTSEAAASASSATLRMSAWNCCWATCFRSGSMKIERKFWVSPPTSSAMPSPPTGKPTCASRTGLARRPACTISAWETPSSSYVRRSEGLLTRAYLHRPVHRQPLLQLPPEVLADLCVFGRALTPNGSSGRSALRPARPPPGVPVPSGRPAQPATITAPIAHGSALTDVLRPEAWGPAPSRISDSVPGRAAGLPGAFGTCIAAALRHRLAVRALHVARAASGRAWRRLDHHGRRD